MRRWVSLLLFAASAVAGAPDGAVAHPHRWCDPNGTPAGTRRSRCLPLTSDVEEAWDTELPGLVVSPIVYWEREAFVACEDGDHFVLVALDVFTGEITAKKTLPKASPRPLPVVWESSVYVRVSNTEVGEFRRVGRTFNRRWVHEPAENHLSDVIVFENEIYAVADGSLVRLRPRWRTPVWATGNGTMRGRPALYGDHVYVLLDQAERGMAESMHVGVYKRRGGEFVAARNAAWYARETPPPAHEPGRITVTKDRLILRGPAPLATQRGSASHVMIDTKDGIPIYSSQQRPPGLMDYPVDPAVTPLGVLVLAKSEQTGWAYLHDDNRFRVFATNQDNPDLFAAKRLVSPTVLGDIVYFGSWAADLRSQQILWRLPVGSLRFPAVPLDRMVLVIDGKNHMRAFRARRSGGAE